MEVVAREVMHPGGSFEVRRRRRAMLALLRGFRWDRPAAAARARELAAEALESAGAQVRRGRESDDRARALVERAVRRLGLVAHLED